MLTYSSLIALTTCEYRYFASYCDEMHCDCSDTTATLMFEIDYRDKSKLSSSETDVTSRTLLSSSLLRV